MFVYEETIWTLSLLYILIIFVMYYTWKICDRFPGTGSWAVGFLGCSMGSIFTMLFWIVPYKALTILGFALLVAGTEFIIRGCGLFLGSPVNRRTSASVILLGVLLTIFLNPYPRIFSASATAVFLFILLRGFLLMMRNIRKVGALGYGSAIAFLTPALLFLYTSLLTCLPEGTIPRLPWGLLNSLFGLLFAAIAYMLSILVHTKYHQMLKDNAHEKGILLREMHHRTKNNLALVASMISLDSQEVEDQKSREIFAQLEDKIQTVALLHQQLQSSGATNCVRADEYLGRVVDSSIHWNEKDRTRISLKTDLEPITLEVSSAIPIGLIVNELVTNARKHAFPEGREGCIRVLLRRKNGSMELVVADDGVGMSRMPRMDSLGLSLIDSLVSQLKGRFRFEHDNGTRAVLTIPAAACA